MTLSTPYHVMIISASALATRSLVPPIRGDKARMSSASAVMCQYSILFIVTLVNDKCCCVSQTFSDFKTFLILKMLHCHRTLCDGSTGHM